MKMPVLSIQALFLAGALALLLTLAGCSDDDANSSNTANSRDDATLDALADDAATASGLSSFSTVTASNAGSVGDSGSGGGDASGQDSTSGYLSINPNAAPGSRASQALNQAMAQLNKGGALLNRTGSGGNHLTTTTTVNSTAPCNDSGSVTITGTVVITSPDGGSSANSGTINVSIQNLVITFNECDEGAYTYWGSMRWNADDTITFSLTADQSDLNISISLDEYLDAGLVVREDATSIAYNFSLRFTLSGTLSGTILTGYTSVNVTATMVVKDNPSGVSYTCTATATTAAELENPTYSCS